MKSESSGVRPTSHNNLRDIAIKELVREGYDRAKIQSEILLGKTRIDVLANGKKTTAIECKSFKHTFEYSREHIKLEGVQRSIICQPYFDVDEMWLVYRTRKNKYIVIKVPRPED
jgi:hypothetical protein